MAEFERAHNDFLDQLSEEETKQFAPIKDSKTFLSEIQNLGQSTKSRKWTKLFTAIKKCSQCLDPYFEVAGIVVQSHPEWAAIAWGSFRLVLSLACNYVSFFDKLADLFDQLNKRIPAYNDLSAVLDRLQTQVTVSQEFSTSLHAFYVDIFEIFRGIARVFTQKTGKLRKTPVVIAQLLWHPFDVRFANVLQRLDSHRKMLEFGMDVIQLQTTSSIALSQADESRRTERLVENLKSYNNIVIHLQSQYDEAEKRTLIDRIRSWINPSCFVDHYERLSALRLDGTAEWIFHADEYVEWVQPSPKSSPEDPMKNFLWVRGNPGAGKSVLAASVVQELLATTYGAQHVSHLTTYFFFEYNGNDGKPASRDKAYRALLSRLMHQFTDNEDILEAFSFAISTKQRHGQMTATTEELIDVLRIMASRVDLWYIIIDGVDECETVDELLLDLNKAFKELPVKVLLFSRPNVRFLRQNMKPRQVMTVSRHNQEDLRGYFNHHLERFQNLGIIPHTANVGQLVDALLIGADGMFQWARLMITHLQSEGLRPWQRVNVIETLTTPENLEDMYERILSLLSKKLVSEQALARQIFAWVALAKKPLTAAQLQDILTPTNQDGASSTNEICQKPEDEEFTNFETSAILVSGSLIEKRWCPYSGDSIYTFIHGSVGDFFKSRYGALGAVSNSVAGSIDYFLPATLQVEAELTLACLSYIIQRIPGKPLSGSMLEVASVAKLSSTRPFVDYAALYWPHHLLSMIKPGRLISIDHIKNCHRNIDLVMTTLGEFLSSKFIPLVWVELRYTFEKTSKRHHAINETLLLWASLAPDLEVPVLSRQFENLPSVVSAFAGSLTTLHELYGDTLVESPHQIWNDITAFTSSPFFATTKAVAIKPLVREDTNRIGSSLVPLSKISRDHAEMNLVAILTIWPSKAFESFSRTLISHRKRSSSDDPFDGWIAQYELWDIDLDDPIVVEDSRIPLDGKEVQMQYEGFEQLMTFYDKLSYGGNVGKELALHFPTSIEEDLQTFTVLTTVFKRRKPLSSDQMSTTSLAATETWQPTIVPIRETIHASMLKGFSSSSPRMNSSNLMGPASPSSEAIFTFKRPVYRLTTHYEFILYQSNEGCGILNENEDMMGTMAVYQMYNNKHIDNVRLLGCTESDGNFGAINHAVFHPDRPLLAFQFLSRRGNSHIALWHFRDSTALGAQFLTLHHELIRRSNTNSGDSLVSIATISSTVKYLQFSACGANLIYQLHDEAYPHIRAIGASPVYKAAGAQTENEGSSDASSRPSPHPGSASRCSAIEKVNALPQAMNPREPVLHANGSVTKLSFDAEASNRNIKLVHSANGTNYEQSLMSLPAWRDVRNVSASVRMPTCTREDKITVILNKTPKPFYVVGSSEHTPPTVVRKDVRAIATPRVVKLLPGSASKTEPLTSWAGVGFRDRQLDDEDKRVGKRLCIDKSI